MRLRRRVLVMLGAVNPTEMDPLDTPSVPERVCYEARRVLAALETKGDGTVDQVHWVIEAVRVLWEIKCEYEDRYERLRADIEGINQELRHEQSLEEFPGRKQTLRGLKDMLMEHEQAVDVLTHTRRN